MPRHLLKPIQVVNARPGDTSDGDGLFLRVKDSGASWVLRYTSPSGKRRESGLGACDRNSTTAAGKSLTLAREAAEEARKLLRAGRDPVDEKRGARERARAEEAKRKADAKAAATTVRRYARAYHEEHIEPVYKGKHGQQWLNSIEQHVPASILDAPVDSISANELLDGLVPILREVPETGSRIYQRLATVFDAAVIDGLIVANPATQIRRELRKRAGRRDRTNFASMQYRTMPALVEKLQAVEGTSARALEFCILTASRTKETLSAEWSEIDLAAGVWVIPASKMKCREQHRVFLSERARAILAGQEGQHDRLVFPSTAKKDAPLSNMALLMSLRRLVKGMTVHGFRSTFSTWANELGIARPDVIEAALAHREENAVRRAYNRAGFLADRRALMSAWGDYLAGKPVKRADGSLVTDAAVIAFPKNQEAA
jgi:integrase